MRTKQIEMPATVRSEVGKGPARRLRAAGKIPAVVYGRTMQSLPVSVDGADFARLVPESAWLSTLIRLHLEGAKKADARPTVMIREVQRDLVRRVVLSIDFHRISLRETVRVHVPVVHVGESPGVKQGGILEQIMHEVEVECLPTMLPDHLVADISELNIGDTLRVKDVTPASGLRIVSPEEEVVLVIAPPVQVEEVAPTVPEIAAVVSETEEPEVIGQRETEE